MEFDSLESITATLVYFISVILLLTSQKKNVIHFKQYCSVGWISTDWQLVSVAETFEVDISNTKKLLEGERGQHVRQKGIKVRHWCSPEFRYFFFQF